MGMGGDACRNLTQTQIDKIRVDMATGYLKTLKGIAGESGNIVDQDVRYDETEKFHKDAFEKSGLSLDNWTLKTAFDLIKQTEGDATAEERWKGLRDTGGDGPDSLFASIKLLAKMWDLQRTTDDPKVARKAQEWINNVPGPEQIGKTIAILDAFHKQLVGPFGSWLYDHLPDAVNRAILAVLNLEFPQAPLGPEFGAQISNTYIGDQRPKIIGVEIDLDVPVEASRFGTYKWSATSWAANGTLNGGVVKADFDDVIKGSAGNGKINGLGGNDALDGSAGNDYMDGEEGSGFNMAFEHLLANDRRYLCVA